MIRISQQELTQFMTQFFVAAGATEENASTVANSLVLANMAGHDSHGVMRCTKYLEAIHDGNIVPNAVPELAVKSGATAQIDGKSCFGQVVAKFSINEAIELAREFGVGATTLYNSHHVGRVGEWVLLAAEQNMAALGLCNVASVRGLVAPHGGKGRLLGTNPFAAAVPIEGQAPFLLDFATSIVAEGKVRVARTAGKPVPDGWIRDVEGYPTNEPMDFYDGGFLQPAGQYKGYALGLLSELLGGVLSGSGWPELPAGQRMRNGMLFIVLDIDRFRPLLDFLTDANTLYEMAKAIPPAPGFDAVLFPGEPERIAAAERAANGIPLHENAWQEISVAAKSLSLSIPHVESGS